MLTTPNLGLIAWNLPSDPYDSEELAENWIKVDQHDHTSGKGAAITTGAIVDGAITRGKLHDAFIQTTRADVSSASSVTITWPTSFVDTDYIATASLEGSSTSTSRITAKSATQITFTFEASITGTLHVIGVHD